MGCPFWVIPEVHLATGIDADFAVSEPAVVKERYNFAEERFIWAETVATLLAQAGSAGEGTSLKCSSSRDMRLISHADRF